MSLRERLVVRVRGFVVPGSSGERLFAAREMGMFPRAGVPAAGQIGQAAMAKLRRQHDRQASGGGARWARLALSMAFFVAVGVGDAFAQDTSDASPPQGGALVVATNSKAVLPERAEGVERPRRVAGRTVVRLDRGRVGVSGAGTVGRPQLELERPGAESLSKPAASARRLPSVPRGALGDRGERDGDEDGSSPTDARKPRQRRARRRSRNSGSKGMPPWVAVTRFR